MTGTCLFSKWVEAEPITAKSAECVYQVLVKWIHCWGVPLKILSDQGTEFLYICNMYVIFLSLPEFASMFLHNNRFIKINL